MKKRGVVFLNSDVGEGMGLDAKIIPLVGGVNISCGAHAGNKKDQRRAILLAAEHGTLIGAHPGFPDPTNFGRVEMEMSIEDLRLSLWEQLDSLESLLSNEGLSMDYIKPHGALYNKMSREEGFSSEVLRALQEWRRLPVMVLANSAAVTAAKKVGAEMITEGFLDRRYTDAGLLVSRSDKEAMITDVNIAVNQAQALMCGRGLVTTTGKVLDVKVDSLCVHGDTEGAVSFLQAVLAEGL